MTGFLVFLFFLYLLSQLVLTTLFYLYLWQLKEYRGDRLLVHLKSPSGKRQLLAYLNFLFWKGFRRPVVTPKVLLLFFLTLFWEFRLWFFFIKLLPFFFSFRAFLSLILVNTFVPFLVALSVFLVQPLVFLLKKLVIFGAKKKLSSFPDLLVVGITGSFGKTSTKEFLATILGEKFKVAKTPQNWNTEIGVAKTILRFLKRGDQVFVVEMGAYKKGEIRAIGRLVQPQIGVITGINQQHLSLFGSLKKTREAKYELIESLPEDGLAVFNGDNPDCRKLAEKTKMKKKLYSLQQVEDIRVKRKKTVFQYQGSVFQLPLLGSFQIGNFLAALTVAKELGLSMPEIIKAGPKIKPLKGTMEPGLGINHSLVIDDTYSSNPAGFLAALDYLEKQRGKKIVVTPGIIELGQASFKIHQQIGQKMAAVADLVIITKPDFAEAMKKGLGEEKPVLVEENPPAVLTILKKEVKKGDLLLLEGRLPEMIKKGVKKTNDQ